MNRFVALFQKFGTICNVRIAQQVCTTKSETETFPSLMYGDICPIYKPLL